MDAFKKIVHADKIRALQEYKKDVDSTDKEAAAMALEFADQCSTEVNVANFSIDENSLQIADDCLFPHYLKALSPSYNLTYDFKKYAKHIKTNKLLKVQ